MEIDQKDKKILQLLKEEANLTTSQLSKKTRLPITTVHNRIKKLQKLQVIKNYTVNINHEKLGVPLKAFILITAGASSHTQKEIGQKIKSLEHVESVSIITGATDLIAEVRAQNMHALSDIITNNIRKIQGVDRTQTLMVLEEI